MRVLGLELAEENHKHFKAAAEHHAFHSALSFEWIETDVVNMLSYDDNSLTVYERRDFVFKYRLQFERNAERNKRIVNSVADIFLFRYYNFAKPVASIHNSVDFPAVLL